MMWIPMLFTIGATAMSFRQTNRPPNVVFIIADDLGSTDLGIHGAEWETPNLDRLFVEGLNFTNYYTQASCTPTRAALMTGRYPFRFGLQPAFTAQPGTTAAIPKDEPTFAESLKKKGYQNHYIGKWHIGSDFWGNTPLGRGWDTFYGLIQGGGDYWGHNISLSNGGQAVDFFGFDVPESPFKTDEDYTFNGLDFWDNKEPVGTAVGQHTNDLLLKRALKILDEKAETPLARFSLTVSFQYVHAPDQAPSSDRADAVKHCDEVEGVKEERIIFCKMVNALDDTVGQIVQKLKDNGQWDNTLLVFTTDNGGMPENPAYTNEISASIGNNYPYRGGKATLYEGGVHTVAFLSGGALPEEFAGAEISGLHHAIDLPVTMLKLVGADVPENADGVDIFDNQSHEVIYIDIEAVPQTETTEFLTSIRMGDMKYIEGAEKLTELIGYDGWYNNGYMVENATFGCGQGCLFNVTADPEERHNLLGDPSTLHWWMANRLDMMVEEVREGDDYVAYAPGFWDVDTTAFKIACHVEPLGHIGVVYPFKEELPEGCAYDYDEETTPQPFTDVPHSPPDARRRPEGRLLAAEETAICGNMKVETSSSSDVVSTPGLRRLLR